MVAVEELVVTRMVHALVSLLLHNKNELSDVSLRPVLARVYIDNGIKFRQGRNC